MTAPPEALAAVRELWPDGVVTLSPLPGGMTNRNWKAESDGRVCVVQLQLAPDAAERLGISRRRQQRAHEYAASAGVAPSILVRHADSGILVCSWQEGRTLGGFGDRDMAAIEELGAVLRTLHRGPCDEQMQCSTADPFAGTWLLRERAQDVNLPAANQFDFALPVLDRIEQKRGSVTPTLTHGDLLPGNILCGPHGVRLIDFEYAAAGDPLYDLGDLAGKNELDPAEVATLVAAYGAPDEEHAAQVVNLFRFVALLREGLWAVAASGNSGEFDYHAYAISLQSRLKSLLNDAAFSADLTSANITAP